MEILEKVILTINNILWSYILIVLLIGLGIYFTIKTKFVQFRYLKEMITLLASGVKSSNSEEKGITSFQAFSISIASRVGTGNIAGVALAISLGGPGAVFWMWLIALIGAASAFVESTLAQLYKEDNGEGTFKGGPAYYMEKGLNSKLMGGVFSVLITISFGFIFNSVQSNTISIALYNSFGFDRLTVGIILSAITALIVFGGVQRVAKISERIVPTMAIVYIAMAIFVLITNISKVPSILTLIFQNAFGIKEVTGGTLGGLILLGIKRGLFSNEAGMGSAPNAAATADVSHPVVQGLIQTLAVFVDTLVICSCTVIIVLLSSADYTNKSLSGITLVQKALASEIGIWAGAFLSICILLFAFSSILGNYYYGEANIEFLNSNKRIMDLYRLIVVIMVLFGSVVEVEIVWTLADLFMGLMAVLNLIAIALLSKKAFILLDDYTKQKTLGIDSPKFIAKNINGMESFSLWNRKR